MIQRVIAAKAFGQSILNSMMFLIMLLSALPVDGQEPRAGATMATLPRLKVSEDHRYLVQEAGEPFLWLGDTAWELFHRLSREDAIHYLNTRAEQGYNVIQAVALAEFDGLHQPSVYGHLPLVDDDPTRPNIKDGPENDYWDHVDSVIREANARKLYVGFLPTWGDKWNKKWGVGPEVFTADNAYTYGLWLGKRYRDAGIIWVLGGDRPVENERHRAIIEAMARGLRAGDDGKHLMTYHPSGGSGSSQFFHDAAWLDFNMRQNGHAIEFTGRYDQTIADYQRQPVKPVLDGEPAYEGHPINFKADQLGHTLASDVRRPLYWDLFTGACGHTYGHHSVWQFWTADREPVNNPLVPWQEAILQPGGRQMQYAKQLLTDTQLLVRVPDDSLIVTSRVKTHVPGAGRYRMVATRDADATRALVYVPGSRVFEVELAKLKGPAVEARWFNPRTGEYTKIGQYQASGRQAFTPAELGEDIDWVLVLESR